MGSSITINSNIASLNAQRRFAQSTSALSDSFSRLSSGLRINRASDDASGLAIAARLDVDAKVYNQGVRNVNDAVSLLNIAEGATSELSNILIRQRELATQASNGALSRAQRLALDAEADALSEEFNRIVNSTDFNGLKLIDKSLDTLRVQAGYGEDGGIAFDLGDGLARNVGDGSFQAGISFQGGNAPSQLFAADFNNDGILDLINGNAEFNNLWITLGNGDGSFKKEVSYDSGFGASQIRISDLNGDGNLDLGVAIEQDFFSVFYGQGDGTFQNRVTFDTGVTTSRYDLADVNGDGVLDAVFSHFGGTDSAVLFGNADGSFGGLVTFDAGFSTNYLTTADVNNDGIQDIVRAGGGTSIQLGNGDGTFQAAYSVGSSSSDTVAVGDFNNDNIVDIIGSKNAGGYLDVLLGDGDGTYSTKLSFAAGSNPGSTLVADVNQDGIDDVLVSSEGDDVVSIFISNGDGSFQARTSAATGGTPFTITSGDFDGDGALDLATANNSDDSVSVLLANSDQVTTTKYIDLTSRESALEAMSFLDDQLIRVNQERGAIGATQSRLSAAVSNLKQARENFLSAKSQITDLDVAKESANLVKNQILQQAGAAILGQANQLPQLALVLLNGD